MKSSGKAIAILLVGLFAIGAAWWVRQHTLKLRQVASQRAQAGHDAPAGAALSPSQTAVLQEQAASIEARVAAHPDDVPTRQALLLTYQQLGQVDKTMAQMEAIVRLQPANRQLRLVLANAWLALKQWPKAELAYLEMTRRWPKDSTGWQGVAAAQYHQGRFEEAAMAARRAVALKPDSPSGQYLMATSLLEYAVQYPQPQLHSAALDLARKEFEHLTRVWPDNGDIYLRLGRICIVTRDTAGAVTYMEKAAQLLSKREDVPVFLAKAYTLSRNEQAARKVVEQGLAQHPDSADLCDAMGQIIQNSGAANADQQAFSLFQKAVQLSPRNERFQERLGAAALRVNQLDQARQAFETAAQLNPSRAYPFQQLASVYARLRDPKRAADAAKQFETLNTSAQQLSHLEAMANTHPNDVALHLTLADRYRVLGERGAARNEYLAMLQVDPHNAHARTSLAALDTSRDDKTAALAPSPQ